MDLCFSIEETPVPYWPEKKDNPAKPFISQLAHKLEFKDHVKVPVGKFVDAFNMTDHIQNKVRRVLDEIQSEMKEHERKERYFECKSIRDDNQVLIALQITRQF